MITVAGTRSLETIEHLHDQIGTFAELSLQHRPKTRFVSLGQLRKSWRHPD